METKPDYMRNKPKRKKQPKQEPKEEFFEAQPQVKKSTYIDTSLLNKFLVPEESKDEELSDQDDFSFL